MILISTLLTKKSGNSQLVTIVLSEVLTHTRTKEINLQN